jgi:hypothetical protein
MSLSLIYAIFGDGRGLPPKDHPKAWYMLGGQLYSWHGWFGCQLRSFEFRAPPAGTERTVLDQRIRIFGVGRRRFGMVECSWSLVGMGRSLDEDTAMIEAFRAKLRALT